MWISGDMNIDVAPDGTIYGVELLNANEQLKAGGAGAIVIVNEALGDEQRIRLVP